MIGGSGEVRGAGAGRADVVIGLILLAASGAIFWLSRDIPSSPFVPVGPTFFPRVLAGVLAGLAVILLVTALAAGARGPAALRGPVGPAILVFGTLGLYILAVPSLGFFSSTFLFLVALGVLLGERRAAAVGRAVIVAAATTLACYLVFERYLHVLFPGGILG